VNYLLYDAFHLLKLFGINPFSFSLFLSCVNFLQQDYFHFSGDADVNFSPEYCYYYDISYSFLFFAGERLLLLLL